MRKLPKYCCRTWLFLESSSPSLSALPLSFCIPDLLAFHVLQWFGHTSLIHQAPGTHHLTLVQLSDPVKVILFQEAFPASSPTLDWQVFPVTGTQDHIMVLKSMYGWLFTPQLDWKHLRAGTVSGPFLCSSHCLNSKENSLQMENSCLKIKIRNRTKMWWLNIKDSGGVVWCPPWFLLQG